MQVAIALFDFSDAVAVVLVLRVRTVAPNRGQTKRMSGNRHMGAMTGRCGDGFMLDVVVSRRRAVKAGWRSGCSCTEPWAGEG